MQAFAQAVGPPPAWRAVKILLPLLAGCTVSAALGVYGSIHDPSGQSIYSFVFTKTIVMKAWFATAAAALAVFQLVSALRLYGKIPIPREVPSWLGTAHRVSGTLAFLIAIPVAFHCLWALGFQKTDARVLAHSVAGCFFFGALAAKVVVVEMKGLPGWWLPVAGGSLFTGLVVVWLTSAFWFFTHFGFQG
jgi:hypothetical protein